MSNDRLSTCQTLFPSDSTALQSNKLVLIAFALKQQSMSNPKAEIDVRGYVASEMAYGDEYGGIKTKDVRAAMQRRINFVRDTLKHIGVAEDKIWVTGTAYSLNRGGEIDVLVRDGKSSFILPPYPPVVTPSSTGEPSSSREQWLDSGAEINVDPKKGEITAEVSLSYQEPTGTRKVLPGISLKFGIGKDGTLNEVGAELVLLKQKLAKQVFWGAVKNVKIAVKAVGFAELEKNESDRVEIKLHAKIKAVLSADVPLPGTTVKIPVELALYVDAAGKVGVAAQVTLIEF